MSLAEVPALLARARVAHEAARRTRAQGDVAGARPQWVQAAMLRMQASDLDPTRLSLAWREEQALTPPGEDTHASLMAYYRKQGVI